MVSSKLLVSALYSFLRKVRHVEKIRQNFQSNDNISFTITLKLADNPPPPRKMTAKLPYVAKIVKRK